MQRSRRCDCRGFRAPYLGLAVAVATLLGPASLQVIPQTAPPPTAGIVVEDASALWEASLDYSEDLDTLLQRVRTRPLIEHAATTWMTLPLRSVGMEAAAGNVGARMRIDYSAVTFVHGMMGSSELMRSTAEVTPRPVVEHAATATLVLGIEESKQLARSTESISTRILVEYARTSDIHAVSNPTSGPDEASPVAPPVPSAPPQPEPALWPWIAAAALGAAIVAIAAVLLLRFGRKDHPKLPEETTLSKP